MCGAESAGHNPTPSYNGPLLRCFFGLHPWPPWGDAVMGTVIDGWTGKVAKGQVQTRVCPACKKKVWRHV